jgi:hypothetical protein
MPSGGQRLGVVRVKLRREVGRKDLGVGAEDDVEPVDVEGARERSLTYR